MALQVKNFSTKTMKTVKAIALQHLTSEGKILAIGHAETPESYMEILNYSIYASLVVPLWFGRYRSD